MNKIEALKAAQDSQIAAAKNGEHYDLFHELSTLLWTLRRDDNTVVENFPYEDPVPLAQDTYIWAIKLRLYLYAMGELNDYGLNKCYPPGRCSKNADGFEAFISVDEFEIIETPTEFETMQTPDWMCIQFKCQKYASKYERIESEKWLSGDCKRCRISVSEPTGLKGE